MDSGKRFRTHFIILSLGYILLGILRFWDKNPESFLMCYAIGAISIIGGILRISFYFIYNNQSRVFQNDLATGVLLLIAGIYIIVRPEITAQFLPTILGFAVVFDSILKLQYSFELKRALFKLWGIILVSSIITTVLGVLLILGTFEKPLAEIFLSIVLLLDGALNLITLFLLVFHLNKKEKLGNKAPSPQETSKASAADTSSTAPNDGILNPLKENKKEKLSFFKRKDKDEIAPPEFDETEIFSDDKDL